MGELVLAALSGGAVGVARMEVARLVNAATRRLARRGRAGEELALIADALARSDEELGAELERLEPEQAQLAARQLDEALVYDGADAAEVQATAALREQAEQLRPLLAQALSAPGNQGQVVQAWGNATVHAPFSVGRDYVVGPVQDSGDQH